MPGRRAAVAFVAARGAAAVLFKNVLRVGMRLIVLQPAVFGDFEQLGSERAAPDAIFRNRVSQA